MDAPVRNAYDLAGCLQVGEHLAKAGFIDQIKQTRLAVFVAPAQVSIIVLGPEASGPASLQGDGTAGEVELQGTEI
jgi:hypothetical protein